VVARFEAALRAEGLNPDAFAAGLEHLKNALSVDRPLRLRDLRGTPLEHVVERYLVEKDGVFSTAIYCYPPAGRWRREAPPALERAVEAIPDAVLTGPNVVSKRLREIVWSDAFRAAGVGLLIVFLLMAVDLGGIRRAAVALLPLAFGLLWMLGWMGWLGFEVNLMNIFVVTMVIGIGVDYGIHLVHRWEESGGDPEAVAGTSRAVVVAALTTMVGFGSLVLSHFPGLRSIGAAAIFGALFSAVGAIVLLPALLHWRRR
jgi:predicted RND superfamily exporter protein